MRLVHIFDGHMDHVTVLCFKGDENKSVVAESNVNKTVESTLFRTGKRNRLTMMIMLHGLHLHMPTLVEVSTELDSKECNLWRL